MLSYRHSFHAGSFADVLKHVVLVEMLEHLLQKAAPFEYIDTHAGAGLFNLKSGDSLKLNEHETGIGRIASKDFPELASYFEVVHAFNKASSLAYYPGSPAIAKHFLRPQDRGWLFELHPQDYESLCNNMQGNRKIRVAREDGLRGMTALLPPTSRRGMVLLDPSYEVKSDYDEVIETVAKAHKKFSAGMFAIWYPVVERRRIEHMERKLVLSGIRNIQRFELSRSADKSGRGMNAAGLFVVNPPWRLFDKMSSLLPRLAKAISDDDAGGYAGRHFKCDVITEE